MASCVANVKIVRSSPTGTTLSSQVGKQACTKLVVKHGEALLRISLRSGEVVIPLEAPVSLFAARLPLGQLTVLLPRAKLRSWGGGTCSIQVQLSDAPQDDLRSLYAALSKMLAASAAASAKAGGGAGTSGKVVRSVFGSGSSSRAAGGGSAFVSRGGTTFGGRGPALGGRPPVQQQQQSKLPHERPPLAPLPANSNQQQQQQQQQRPTASVARSVHSLRSNASGGGGSVCTGEVSSGCVGGGVGGDGRLPRAASGSLLATMVARAPSGPGGGVCSIGGGGAGAAAAAADEVSSAMQRAAAAADALPPLSDEQRRVLDMVKAGKSIFFSGCAGTGKSLLLAHIVNALPASSTFVTASTGLAASALNGMTLNSFAGVGRAEGPIEQLVKAASRPDAASRWRRASVLIIDEVSMVDGRMFDRLEAIARAVRGNHHPFGGIQLVLSGDFHQLPPVAKGHMGQQLRKFCFEGAAWSRCVEEVVLLQRVFRQNNLDFVRILGAVRAGRCPRPMLELLLARCCRELDTSDGILPCLLYTHRADVERINEMKLEALEEEEVTFVASDSGSAELLQSGCPARRELKLKVGAQVMLVANVDTRRGLVNGARGVVTAFKGPGSLPVVRFAAGAEVTVARESWTVKSGGVVVAERRQLPLELAWALSIHKSQGMTLDKVEVNLSAAFEPGMVYVALSRVKTLEGLRIVGGIDAASLEAHPKVLAFYKALENGADPTAAAAMDEDC